MTTSLTTPRAQSQAIIRLRRGLAVVAVLACLPYLTLKGAWMLGSRVGLNDPDFGHSAVMYTANAVTAGMEAVAMVLAVAFVSAWGRRLPSWLVLPPMYVGSGLLGGILLILPIQLVLTPTRPAAATPPSPIADWVFALVYTGFGVLGVSLLSGFALYAHDRWIRPRGWDRPLGTWRAADGRRPVVIVAVASAAVSAFYVWRFVADPFHPGSDLEAGLGALLAGGALLSLARRRPAQLRGTVPLILAWVATAQLLTWGLYSTFLLTVPNDLTTPGSAVTIAPELLRVVIGAAGATALAGLLREPGPAATAVTPSIPTGT